MRLRQKKHLEDFFLSKFGMNAHCTHPDNINWSSCSQFAWSSLILLCVSSSALKIFGICLQQCILQLVFCCFRGKKLSSPCLIGIGLENICAMKRGSAEIELLSVDGSPKIRYHNLLKTERTVLRVSSDIAYTHLILFIENHTYNWMRDKSVETVNCS